MEHHDDVWTDLNAHYSAHYASSSSHLSSRHANPPSAKSSKPFDWNLLVKPVSIPGLMNVKKGKKRAREGEVSAPSSLLSKDKVVHVKREKKVTMKMETKASVQEEEKAAQLVPVTAPEPPMQQPKKPKVSKKNKFKPLVPSDSTHPAPPTITSSEPSPNNQPQQQPKKSSSDKSSSGKSSVPKPLSAPPVVNPPRPPSSSLIDKMQAKLQGGRFRSLNEALYTQTGSEALAMMSRDPELFDRYHEGFHQQTISWPKQPIDVAVKWLQGLPNSHVVADFGCGEAALSRSVKQASDTPPLTTSQTFPTLSV